MHKFSCFIFLCFYSTILYAQKTDSLHIFYRSDESALSKLDLQALDRFLSTAWDQVKIRSYADVTNEDEYNLELSRNRATEVFEYLVARNVAAGIITIEYFGESIHLADNETEEGRALNRRTTITGYQYARIAKRPVDDPSRQVTRTLNNGFIVTYRPKDLPAELYNQFEAGWGSNFTVITNTTGMRNANLYNNTTNGEILSSVMIFSGGRYNPCKLDSPIFIKVPVPLTECPMDSIRFFAAVDQGGRRIWQERAVALQAETIHGQRYMGVWMDDFCGVYNFDFKVKPGCFDIDSMGLITKSKSIKNLSSELVGLNSVYLPRRVNDSLYSIWYVKQESGNGNVSFSLFNGKRVLKRFFNQPLSSFPVSHDSKAVVLTTDSLRFQYRGVKDLAIVLRVNRDVYRQIPEKNQYRFVYLRRSNEKIRVDIYATGRGKKLLEYKNVPVELIPFDKTTGYYKIDKEFVRSLAVMKKEAEKQAAVTKESLSSK